MEVKLTNGKIIRLRLSGKRIDYEPSKSEFQTKIKHKLITQYPNDLIFEEVYIPGENLILDFFIPSLKLVIECQGKQHYEYISFFHKTKRDFYRHQDRDLKKRAWCQLNNFKLIEILYESTE